MKAARTYVFVFIPVLLERVGGGRVAPCFDAGSNGSSPTDHEYNACLRLRAPVRQECEAEALPSNLFWTWFVDNPHPSSKSS